MKKNQDLSETHAWISGCSIVFMAVLAGIAYYLFSTVHQVHAPSHTSLGDSETSIRVVIYLFMIVILLDIVVAWGIHELFRQNSLAILVSWLRLSYVPFLAFSLTDLLSLTTGNRAHTLSGHNIAMHFHNFLDVWSLGLILFGFHLLLLACLLYQQQAPRVVYALLLLAGLCYIVHNSLYILFAEYQKIKDTVEAILSLPMAAGELVFAVWLIRNARAKKDL